MKTKLNISSVCGGWLKVDSAEVVHFSQSVVIVEIKALKKTALCSTGPGNDFINLVGLDPTDNTTTVWFPDFPEFQVYSVMIKNHAEGSYISVVLLRSEENTDAAFLCTSVRIGEEYEDLMKTLEKETTAGVSYFSSSNNPFKETDIFGKLYIRKVSGNLTWSGIELIEDNAQNVSVEEFIKFAVENFPAKVDYYYTKPGKLMDLAKLLQGIEDDTKVTWSNGGKPTEMDVSVRDLLMLSVEKGTLTRGGSNVDWTAGDLVYREVLPGEFYERAKEIRPKEEKTVMVVDVSPFKKWMEEMVSQAVTDPEDTEDPEETEVRDDETIAGVVVYSVQERDEFLKKLSEVSSVLWRSGDELLLCDFILEPCSSDPVAFYLAIDADTGAYLAQNVHNGCLKHFTPHSFSKEEFLSKAAQICPRPDGYSLVCDDDLDITEVFQTLESKTSVTWNSDHKPTGYIPKRKPIFLHFNTYNYKLSVGQKNPSKIHQDVDLAKFIDVVKSFCPKD